MKRFINILPDRFKWSIHNIIAHPLMEICFLIGLDKTANLVHDCTIPEKNVYND